jgi:uncharacterized protein YkwD
LAKKKYNNLMKKALCIILLVLASITTAFSQDKHDQMFLSLINDYRTSLGLNPVKYDSLLDSAAKVQSIWMQKFEKVSHDIGVHARLEIIDPNYRDKIRQMLIVENCYGDMHSNGKVSGVSGVTEADIKCTFDGWKSSPGHNAAMIIPETTSLGFDIRGGVMADGVGYLIVATMVAGTKVGSPVTNVE